MYFTIIAYSFRFVKSFFASIKYL